MGYVVFHMQKIHGTDSGTSAHIERKVKPSNADEERTYLNRPYWGIFSVACNAAQKFPNKLCLFEKRRGLYAKVTDDMLAKGFDEMADIYSAKYSLAR